ncbi:MAG: MinD/ParA family protein [Cyanobacteria bacterium J06632_22]
MTQIVSIHSYRGGAGKSTLAANLAACLAQQGQRVGIIDTDIPSPGLHLLFGLDDAQLTWTLNDYLWRRCSITDIAYDVSPQLSPKPDTPPSVSQRQRGALWVIPASSQVQDITTFLSEGYDMQRLVTGIQELSQQFDLDYLFVDTHPGLNEETLLSINVSHTLLMVLQPDYQDYQGTRILVDTAQQMAAQKLFLVMNKVLPQDGHADDLGEYFSTPPQCSVTGHLPFCYEMMRLASKGLFCVRYPNHPLTQMLYRILKNCGLTARSPQQAPSSSPLEPRSTPTRATTDPPFGIGRRLSLGVLL